MASIQQSVKIVGRWRIVGWPRGALGGGGGLVRDKKKNWPMSPGLPLIELLPLWVWPPEKRTKETLTPSGCVTMRQTEESVHRVHLAWCTAIPGLWVQPLLSSHPHRGGALSCGDADWAQVRGGLSFTADRQTLVSVLHKYAVFLL